MGRIGFFLAGVGIAALAAPAFAQDAPPQTPPEGPGLQDIVVTAQRRSERLQDVPVAITAAGAQQLATARVENIANVAAISPSVQFTAGNISTSTANIQIRGLGTTGNSRSFEGAVGVFIDGVYRTRAAAALQNFNDIDNLQILRGPQGTLFGKNTSAGAVLISSTAPELDRVEGKYEIGYGNFDTFLAKGAVNVPLSENAAIRVAGLYSTRDGIYKDVNTGKRLNGDETYAFKGQFLFEPVDTVKIRLIGDYSRGHGACCYATSNLVDGPTQPLVDALTLALGLKTPSTRLKDYEVALNHPGNQVVKDYGGTLLTDIELGGDTLKSVTALRKFSVIQTDVDPDFSGADIFSLDEDFASRFFSQELTYNGKISSLNANYVLGAFYSNEKLSMARATRWGSQGQVYWDTLLSAAGLPPGTVYAAPGTWATEAMGGRSRSYAAFAHFDFKVGDKWNIIAGLRYSIEKKSGFFFNPFYRSEPNDVFRVLGVQPGPAYNASRTDKALSGTFGIQYHPSRDAMIYLTYNRGFKAGGVCPPIIPRKCRALRLSIRPIVLRKWTRSNWARRSNISIAAHGRMWRSFTTMFLTFRSRSSSACSLPCSTQSLLKPMGWKSKTCSRSMMPSRSVLTVPGCLRRHLVMIPTSIPCFPGIASATRRNSRAMPRSISISRSPTTSASLAVFSTNIPDRNCITRPRSSGDRRSAS